MNIRVKLLAAVCFLFTFAVAASADSLELIAHIPFDFFAGSKKLPAGDYLIKETGSNVILLQNRGEETASAFLTYGGYANSTAHEPGLTFQKTGDDRYLVRVQMTGESSRVLDVRHAK